MKRFYLTGQRTFANRGCEAIIRSTVRLLREQFGDIAVLVPSDNIAYDSKQWPEAAQHGVQFVPAFTSAYARSWVHLQRLPISMLKRAGWPFPMPVWLKEQIASVDAVLAVGGDNYSLDYRMPSPVMGVDALAMKLGKPVILWGASVGPFEREPLFVAAMARHLGRMSLNAVRESVSYDYLTKVLGLKNVIRMADPAFTLVKQEVDRTAFWPDDQGNGVIGLNISPLIEKFKHAGQDLRVEAVQFVRHVVQKMNYGVLLVPHVVPSDNAPGNNDAHYMQMIGDACSDLGGAVRIMPSAFNAAQIKYVISQLRFFIGARTHATIAALSSGVPTISIAYSVKARGINRDLFGHEETVLPTPEVSSQTLVAALNLLVRNEADFRTALRQKIPEYEAMIRAAVVKIKDLTMGDACG